MTTRILMKCGCVAQGVLTSIRGVPVNPPVPSCVIHDCIEPADAKPDLTGRKARCVYNHNSRPGQPPRPSSFDLAFFEYCGPGSQRATEYCVCGYLKSAHDAATDACPRNTKPLSGKRSPTGKFQARGPLEFDLYYCGCFGWD